MILKMARNMVRTRRPRIPYGSMLELMEIIEAGRLSRKSGKPVSLEDVRAACPVPLPAELQPVRV